MNTNEYTEMDGDILAGKKYTCDLKGLSKYQRVLCEKIVNDAIYYAKLDKLTEESCIINLKSTNQTLKETSEILNPEHDIDDA